MWYRERTKKDKNTLTPEFHLCCSVGNIQLPLLTDPPDVLKHLVFDHDSTDSKNYQ